MADVNGYSRTRRFLRDEDSEGLDVWSGEAPGLASRQGFLYLLVPDLGGRQFLVSYTEGVGGVKVKPVVVGALLSVDNSNGRLIYDLEGPIPEADKAVIKAEMDKHVYEGKLEFSKPHNFEEGQRSGRLERVQV